MGFVYELPVFALHAISEAKFSGAHFCTALDPLTCVIAISFSCHALSLIRQSLRGADWPHKNRAKITMPCYFSDMYTTPKGTFLL
jgi:hypothetical protein